MRSQRHNEPLAEAERNAHRTSRSYEINGQWYFELRGGGQKGPFASKDEMQVELNEFIRFHEEMNQQI